VDVPDALVWTAPLVVGIVVWQVASFPVGMLAMLLSSALVWFVLEQQP